MRHLTQAHSGQCQDGFFLAKAAVQAFVGYRILMGRCLGTCLDCCVRVSLCLGGQACLGATLRLKLNSTRIRLWHRP